NEVIPSFLIVKRRCRPSGKASGHRWETSPFEASGTVRVSTAPPLSPTNIKPAFAAGENTIPRRVQTAPFVPPGASFAATSVGTPPAIDTLLTPWFENPSHLPSGEKNGS